MTLADPRPGGRAARVQQAVHEAVRALQREQGAVTVPRVAALAGVAPSTIYRRWGDLNGLLADVAVARLRPHGLPDTGSIRGDLTAWAAEYIEEAGSPTGRSFMRDMVSGGTDGVSAIRGGAYARERVQALLGRARQRGEAAPDVDDIIDVVLAPIVYRILLEPGDLPGDLAPRLVGRLFAQA